ncbi:MAG TPA: ACT domain-containing protein [Candidatus Thalassarchaeaceae archaeon]|nr:ACT domain-containing protein [Candidatus Thalassarchaeaceae archaeon]MDP6844266.1 ACT domain-containing protein [Candidatus Thalassarchaeaceae archaeon]HJM41145.1 ACT domain-containing protein [Candidatus Thalassarchaeaceae archaeon]
MSEGRLEFKIELRDEVGQLALVSREFANRGINIETMCAIDTNVVIVTNQTVEARMALDSLEISYATTQLLSQSMPDKPGALADFSERLGEAGVSITSIYVLSRIQGATELAFSVDNIDKARATLNLHESVPP